MPARDRPDREAGRWAGNTSQDERPAAIADLRPGHGSDLRPGGDRIYAAVADVPDHQLRSRRIRHAAGLLRAGGHALSRHELLARAAPRLRPLAVPARLRVQEIPGRPAVAPRRIAAGDRDGGTGDPLQGIGEELLQR